MANSPTKEALRAKIKAAQEKDKLDAKARAQRLEQTKQERIEEAQGPIESDLRTILSESGDERVVTLSDGREIRINPIKPRQIPRWSGYFMKLASLGDVKDGQVQTSIQMTPAKLAQFSALAPELGDMFIELMSLCIDGVDVDELIPDDFFMVVEKFSTLNLTETFTGKAVALASGMRG